MTPQDELKYLTQLVLEASRWRVSEDQADEDPLRLEITQRIYALQGTEPEVIDGRVQSVRERGLAKQEAKQKHGQLRPGFHRVSVNGKKLTLHESQLEKVPYAQSPTGYRWKIRDGVVPNTSETNK
jgi:hypothetical protein